MAITLTKKQINTLRQFIEKFLYYLTKAEFQRDQQERIKRMSYFQSELPTKLAGLAEADITQIVTQLWASEMWGNKEYLAQKVLTDNGIDKLRKELSNLLNKSIQPGNRYERWLKEIKHLGPASVTEIMCYFEPDRCGIWNRRARDAIKNLGLNDFVDPAKYRISGSEYESFNELLITIGKQLIAFGVKTKPVDLLLVDFFLFEVTNPNNATPATPRLPLTPFDHDEIRDLVKFIGINLGFDADTEVPIAPGATVDVIWRARIGNLGMVKYIFEVQKRGSVDSLILNLQKALRGHAVQKVVAVSDEPQLERIKKEIQNLSEDFRRSVGFWSVLEVQQVAENLRTVTEAIEKLGLTPRSI